MMGQGQQGRSCEWWARWPHWAAMLKLYQKHWRWVLQVEFIACAKALDIETWVGAISVIGDDALS